jgi:hypothetical protein
VKKIVLAVAVLYLVAAAVEIAGDYANPTRMKFFSIVPKFIWSILPKPGGG